MQPNEYQKLALRTEKTPTFIETTSSNPHADNVALSRLFHAALGVCSEAGELHDMIKKHLIYGKELDVVNVIEECGDMLWYIALALDAVGFNMEETMERNIAKLKARYGDKFSAERALNVDAKKEREILEGRTPDDVKENWGGDR